MQEGHRMALRQAYQFIKDRQFLEARPLVLNVLREDQNNIDAWWLAVYSAQSTPEKQAAITRVLKLEPSHQAALALQKRLAQRTQSKPVTGPLSPEALKPRLKLDQHSSKKRINKTVWAFRIFGLLCLWGVCFYIVDGFFGGKFSKPLEEILGVEPEALGWVDSTTGEEVQEDEVSKEGRIPITYQEKINISDDVKLNTIRQNEAHAYEFSALAGFELVIAAQFSTGADSPIQALEIWDRHGNVIAHEEPMTDLRSQIEQSGLEADLMASLISVRAIQFVAPSTDVYKVVVISRAGGPAGQYSLFVTSMGAAIGSYQDYAD